MKKIILSCILCTLFCLQCSALSFNQTINLLKAAILKGDTKTITKYVDLEGILKNKIKKNANLIGQQTSTSSKIAGKIVDFSEPAINKAAAVFILNQFSKSSPELRRYYLTKLNFTLVEENNRSAFAIGSFAGNPAYLAAVKNNGNWMIIAVESPAIDREVKNLLKIIYR